MRAKLKSVRPMVVLMAAAFLLSGCHYYYHPYGYHGFYGHHGHGHHKHKRGRY